MMIETMAGESGALHGLMHDATPFRLDEKNTDKLLKEKDFFFTLHIYSYGIFRVCIQQHLDSTNFLL